MDKGGYDLLVILQGKDVDGALVRRATEPLVIRAKGDAMKQSLVSSSSELDQHLLRDRVPNADEGALAAGSGYNGTLLVQAQAVKIALVGVDDDRRLADGLFGG